MRTLLSLFLLLFLSFVSLQAESFQKAVKEPKLLQQGDAAPWCPVCGMNLGKFYKTNHAQTAKNGQTRQYCSIRCLAADHPHHPHSVKVVDADTARFIDAATAHYLIGSKLPGTMSMTSKYAFRDEATARKYQKRYGGTLAGFDEALKQARADMAQDDTMRMKKKEKMVYPKGKMLYQKLCKQEIDADAFDSVADLKAHIRTRGLCKGMDEEKLQAVGLYLFDHRRGAGHAHGKTISASAIDVPATAKCPVCGMFVAKYPRWAAKMTMPGGEEHYFDGAKDMFKFYLQQRFASKGAGGLVLVTDYYAQHAIPGKGAFYVVGSDVFGPMGNELIPFRTLKDARTFAKDHRGEKILRFEEVDMALLKKLDE